MENKSAVIGVIDYGCGNIKSVINALAKIGVDSHIITLPEDIMLFNKILLPGVGSFDHAVESLEKRNLITPIQEWVLKKENKLLGICLGMQLLCKNSDESVLNKKGLGLIDAEVKCLTDKSQTYVKIPHMGWNDIEVINSENPILKGIDDRTDFYFVHSYGVFSESKEVIVAETDYGVRFAALLSTGSNSYGVQYHPEKSQTSGMKL
jgi:glutamine amidotransferase